MARPRKIREDIIVDFLNEYILHNPLGKKIIKMDFVRYVQLQGYANFTNYDVNRCEKVNKIIDEYNEQWKKSIAEGADIGVCLDPAVIVEGCTTKDKTFQRIELLINLMNAHKNRTKKVEQINFQLEKELNQLRQELSKTKKEVIDYKNENILLQKSLQIIKAWIKESQEQKSVEEMLARNGIHLKSRGVAREWTGTLVVPPKKKSGCKNRLIDLSEFNTYIIHTLEDESTEAVESPQSMEIVGTEDDFMTDFYKEYGGAIVEED